MGEVLLTALAHIHLQRIHARFEDYSPGLGDKFANDVDAALNLIACCLAADQNLAVVACDVDVNLAAKTTFYFKQRSVLDIFIVDEYSTCATVFGHRNDRRGTANNERRAGR